ncbi:DUF4178 domain-containing protein [Streptomyces sp. NPDC056405]|uniref:DUF4178 domain-containing protein n=1 Tax=Streptomyces sp. NPDC056405 TaxID=3345811 RepID=UPI0035D87CD4
MSAPPHRPWNPACEAAAARLTVGSTIQLDAAAWTVTGRILATDHEETWVECFLTRRLPPQPPADPEPYSHWLALETLTGEPRLSRWHRSEASAARFVLEDAPTGGATLDGAPVREVQRGEAHFTAEGDFGPYATDIPASGLLVHREYATADGRRVAATRFDPGPAAWLIGRNAPLGAPLATPFAPSRTEELPQ